MPWITLKVPTGPVVSHRLEGEVLSIGRSSACDLVVRDVVVSRRHAEIRRRDGQWILVDLGSTHGTRHRRVRVEHPVVLSPGDEIRVGRAVLTFSDDASFERTTGEDIPTPPSDDAPQPALVGQSPAILKLVARIGQVASSDATVLVTGETGTGKELVARIIHERSPRCDAAFVVVNCPALPGTLLESELFGVEPGVATGVTARPGLLETAAGGTLFLDEIGDMDGAAQAKLLRFLQDRMVLRVGSRKAIRIDARVICATHRDLDAAMLRGEFRRDLFHRLNTVHLHLPPLRERREDLDLLVQHVLATGKRPVTLTPAALALLRAHDFPGNVRELEQVLTGARLLATGGVIQADDLPAGMRQDREEGSGVGAAADALYRRIVAEEESFWDVVQRPYLRRELSREVVRRLVERVHAECGGSYKAVARLFRIEAEHRKLIDFLRHHDLGASRRT